MRCIDRLNLIDKIARELQSRMSYSDIDIFLKSFGIDITQKKTSGANSKWVYSKELLADENESVILQVADELDIAHGFTVASGVAQESSRFWVPGYFRLFISHLSENKLKATSLKEGLRKYGISCFVAHEDINPTLEWQEEIEKALSSMDALAAILMPGFGDSKWTDQEIGYALGRDILVIPLRNGLDPYGFIGKLQGVPCQGRSVAQVAAAVFQAVSNNRMTKNKIATTLVDQVISSATVDSGVHFLACLRQINTLAQSHLERLRDNLNANAVLSGSTKFIDELNSLLSERDIALFEKAPQGATIDDDIPF